MQTQSEAIIDKLFKLTNEVIDGKTNPKHGLAISSMIDTLVKAALNDSIHQKNQRKIPTVKFFDEKIVTQLKGN